MTSVITPEFQSLLDSLEGTSYVADGDGRLVALGRPRWDAFARGNDAADLADPDRVLGRSLFDFIAGDEVREPWQRAFTLLASGVVDEITLPCRCDSPTIERHMRVAMTPVRLAGRPTAYLFQAVTLEERMRPPLGLFAADGGRLVALCSFCHAVRPDEHSPWQSAESYYADGGSSRVTLTHGVCPDCRDVWMRSLGLGG